MNDDPTQADLDDAAHYHQQLLERQRREHPWWCGCVDCLPHPPEHLPFEGRKAVLDGNMDRLEFGMRKVKKFF